MLNVELKGDIMSDHSKAPKTNSLGTASKKTKKLSASAAKKKTTSKRKQSKKTSISSKAKKTTKSKPKSTGKKSVVLDASTHNALVNIRDEMSQKMGGRITYSMVIQTLLNDRIDLQNVQKEMQQIKAEADQTQEFIKGLLEKAISNQNPVIAMPNQYQMPYYPPNGQMMGGMQPPNSNNLGYPSMAQNRPPPPPPPSMSPPPTTVPPPIKPPEINLEDIETDSEIKDAFNKEKKAIFDGNLRKPSEILAMTKPKHSEHQIAHFSGDAPSLVKNSFALKNAPKFKKELKREL